MLYYNFENYDEFKEIFGIIEHGNGVKSRRNKILLALYKDKKAFKKHVAMRSFRVLRNELLHASWREDHTYHDGKIGKNHIRWYEIYMEYNKRCVSMSYTNAPEYKLLLRRELSSLKTALIDILTNSEYACPDAVFDMHIGSRYFRSDKYRTDDFIGLCEDGTTNSIRYVNVEKGRVYKMRAGKMFNHIMSCNRVLRCMPEQIQRWLSEEYVAEWIQYASEQLKSNEYELYVDDDFDSIYNSERCAGYEDDSDSFGSCMVDDGQYKFYEQSIEAKAAYIEDSDNMIVARCIIYTDVTDQDGKKWRLAERQYSAGSDLALQRQLVSALIRGGHIDGYKKVGASCHDSRAFVDNEGNSLADYKFKIKNTIDFGDTLSYQDSFKWYVKQEQTAYNYNPCSEYDVLMLDTTESVLEGNDHEHERWSNYNDCWIDEDEACYDEGRDDFFYPHQTREAHVYSSHRDNYDRVEWCFEDDVVEIDGEYYYAGTDCDYLREYGIGQCPECENYFLLRDAVYDDFTDEYYCCHDCAEEASWIAKKDAGWKESEYDSQLYEDAENVIEAYEWGWKYFKSEGFRYCYSETTIHLDTLNELIEKGEATFVGDTAYIDHIGYDGEPVHIAAA